MFNSSQNPSPVNLTHTNLCEAIVASICDCYLALLPSDTEAIEDFLKAAAFAPMAGISSTHYLRLAVAGLKRAGARSLARDVMSLYLDIVKAED